MTALETKIDSRGGGGVSLLFVAQSMFTVRSLPGLVTNSDSYRSFKCELNNLQLKLK